MSRVSSSFTFLLLFLAGSAQAATSFYDDFSSGTLNQWTVVSPFVFVDGTDPSDYNAFLANADGYDPVMFGNSVLEPGQYLLEFLMMGDAPYMSFARFDLYAAMNPGAFTPSYETYLQNMQGFWAEAQGHVVMYQDFVTEFEIYLNEYEPWIYVTATFTASDISFFSMSLYSPSCGVLRLDDFKITPLGNPDAPVPEPTSLALIGCGLVGVVARTIRRKKA